MTELVLCVVGVAAFAPWVFSLSGCFFVVVVVVVVVVAVVAVLETLCKTFLFSYVKPVRKQIDGPLITVGTIKTVQLVLVRACKACKTA